MTLYGKPADREDGSLAPQNDHLMMGGGLEARLFYRAEMGEVRKQSKKSTNLANISQKCKPQAGDVLISSFLPSTGGQVSQQRHFKSQAEWQDSLRQPIRCDYNKSKGKQVKEAVSAWSQNWLLSATGPLQP